MQTLIGAWQIKALTTKYLQEWLTISSVHLKDIEEAAAPAGWQCEWDRYDIALFPSLLDMLANLLISLVATLKSLDEAVENNKERLAAVSRVAFI